MASQNILPSDLRSLVEEAIRRILISQLGVDAGRLAKNGSATPLLGRGIGLDSMEALALVSALEEEFQMEVDDADMKLALFATLSTLADYVVGKISARRKC
jgi:acyl carrier protein